MQSTKPARGTISFILVTAFLNLAGIGIINPVYPFIVGKYTNHQDTAFVIALLFTSYSLFQFLAVPTLGALSDRYGRRPILLISLLGSAAGYFIFGLGGALWVLFLGRITDGITGGNLAAIYAYAADITEQKNRTQFFGLIGAVSGMAFVIGPALGGLIYAVTKIYEAPLYFAAAVTLLNAVWGYFVMPESLSAERREKIKLARLNPITQLVGAFALPQLRLLFAGTFLWTLAFSMLQSNLSFLTEDRLHWTPEGTSTVFFVIGLVGILTQGLLIRRLLPRFGESKLAVAGMASLASGLLLIGLVSVTLLVPVLYLGVLFTALGNGLITPSLNGLLSQAVSAREQGRVQGGSQSVQALGRVFGPLWGGSTYGSLGPAAPYLSGTVGVLLGAGAIIASIPVLAAHKAKRSEVPLPTGDSPV